MTTGHQDESQAEVAQFHAAIPVPPNLPLAASRPAHGSGRQLPPMGQYRRTQAPKTKGPGPKAKAPARLVPSTYLQSGPTQSGPHARQLSLVCSFRRGPSHAEVSEASAPVLWLFCDLLRPLLLQPQLLKLLWRHGRLAEQGLAERAVFFGNAGPSSVKVVSSTAICSAVVFPMCVRIAGHFGVSNCKPLQT